MDQRASLLGRRIKRLREQRGLTQGQLAKYADVSRQWVSKLEAGKTYEPGSDRMARVAGVLRVSLPVLLGREDVPVSLVDRVVGLLQAARLSPEGEKLILQLLEAFIQYEQQRRTAVRQATELSRQLAASRPGQSPETPWTDQEWQQIERLLYHTRDIANVPPGDVIVGNEDQED